MALRAFSSMILSGQRAIPVVLAAAILVAAACTDGSYPLLSSVPEPPGNVSSSEEITGIVTSLSELKGAIEEDMANRPHTVSRN